MRSIILVFVFLCLAGGCGRRPGKVGLTGAPGTNGTDGLSLVVNVVELTTEDSIACKLTNIYQDTNRDGLYSTGDTYNNGFLVCDGAVGAQGEQGVAGEQGETGEDGTDGTNGTNGLNADTTYSIVSIVDPCGDTPGVYDEVILKLGNGTYISSFSDNVQGYNTRLGILTHGTFMTTDGTSCVFTI